ncbi:ferredoxin [Bacteroidia bacterium]|nr:ferredoxin [Bacteroidia bacterium]
MSNVIIVALIVLGAVALISAFILYFVAQKFKVEEDPRIDLVAECLPGANCGGCGYAGCRNFADMVVKKGSLEGMLCPVGGAAMMEQIAAVMGVQASVGEPKVAVVCCSGSLQNAPRTVSFDGVHNCQFSSNIYTGTAGCPQGCVGFGDCVKKCQFGALSINAETGLPEVDETTCTACGACIKACPRGIIKLRNKGFKSRRIWVSCVNKEKGALARKHCTVACIGCGKCQKVCAFEAITVTNNVAYLDYMKCKLCRKCVVECPTGAIHELNFPAKNN